ncbi:MAG: UvrD-helicase domain-containing protein [Chloroflexota bacterium]
MNELTAIQQEVVTAGGSSFLLGPFGSGKSTALYERLWHLLEQGEPPYTVLVLVAEAEDRRHFLEHLRRRGREPDGDLMTTTYTFLAREMVHTFWPLVARPAGFPHPYQPPTYLHYDLAQLLMWQIVRPMLREGAFADLHVRPQQIVSQVLDTLNRSALNGLSLAEANERQARSWAQSAEERKHLREATTAAEKFREHCRQHSLLDVSLAVRVFDTQLLQHADFRRYFSERFRHIIVDNVEEQTPAGQHFLASLMPEVASTAIAYDLGGGYKRFLSADPQGAKQFEQHSAHTFHFDTRFVSREPLAHLSHAVSRYLTREAGDAPSGRAHEAILQVVQSRYRHEMAQDAARALPSLLEALEVAPADVAIVTPMLDDALRHTLSQTLGQLNLPYVISRRRSSPRDDAQTRALLTWLALAHPEWDLPPDPFDVAEAIALSHTAIDPARASLLVQGLYDEENGILLPISELTTEDAQRAGQEKAEHLEELREWLAAHGELTPDVFLHRLYDDVLGQPPFAPDGAPSAAATVQWLAEIAARLKRAGPQMGLQGNAATGRAFLSAINDGLVTPDPPPSGEPPQADGIFISTVHGYLLANRVSAVQLWLDVSSIAWWDTPRQPLSNVFVLSPQWPQEQTWTMAQDYRARNQLLSALISGLTARCRQGVVLASSTLDRRGQRQESPLWHALQPVLDQHRQEADRRQN